VVIDSIREADGQWRVRTNTGDPGKTRALGVRTLDTIVEAQRLGAGEIVLNGMDSDGVRRGYDIVQLRQARALCRVPLVASGGAGAPEHFAEAFERADVDGALAASVFHSGAIAIPELKRYLRQSRSRCVMSEDSSAGAVGRIGVFPVGLDWDKSGGLLPVIVQDADNLRVLMLGYMDREALQATMARRLVTFYSRSKQRLWTKGRSEERRVGKER